MTKITKATIHRILKSLSPKREIKSPKRGHRVIPRSITPKAIEYITKHMNEYLEGIVRACEQSLKELNENPNRYYQQHKYDLRVVKNAIEKHIRKSS